MVIMVKEMKEQIKLLLALNPKIKKLVGVILIIVGISALVTPFTPGSWLVFVGLEFLGIRFLAWEKIKKWFSKNDSKKHTSERNMTETAVFGGGCFWCTEAVFKMLKGVSSVLPGYAGGATKNPTYEQVSSGRTGHAEVVRITYNPPAFADLPVRGTQAGAASAGRQQTTYKDLLTVFFGSHDPTTLNRQGSDVGTQYRSVIFYTTPEQKKVAEDFIKEINDSNVHGAPVVTELEPLDTFYEAENYHRDYFATHPDNPYCEVVINPKLEKVQKEFANLLNKK